MACGEESKEMEMFFSTEELEALQTEISPILEGGTELLILSIS